MMPRSRWRRRMARRRRMVGFLVFLRLFGLK